MLPVLSLQQGLLLHPCIQRTVAGMQWFQAVGDQPVGCWVFLDGARWTREWLEDLSLISKLTGDETQVTELWCDLEPIIIGGEPCMFHLQSALWFIRLAQLIGSATPFASTWIEAMQSH